MEPEDKRRQSTWQTRHDRSEELPDFTDEFGPARSPLEELRENPFLGPDDDIPPATPDPPRQNRPTRRAARAPQGDSVLTGTTLIAVIAYFALGGIALIITGLILSGFAGILMALVGLLSAAAAGLAGWQQFANQRGN